MRRPASLTGRQKWTHIIVSLRRIRSPGTDLEHSRLGVTAWSRGGSQIFVVIIIIIIKASQYCYLHGGRVETREQAPRTTSRLQLHVDSRAGVGFLALLSQSLISHPAARCIHGGSLQTVLRPGVTASEGTGGFSGLELMSSQADATPSLTVQ